MKTVLITGASKGIGLQIAQTLHAADYNVIGTSRSPKQLQLHGFRMLALDVTQQASIEACIAAVIRETETIDVLINNAGYDLYGAAEETSPDELVEQMQTNFLGAAHLTRLVLPVMRQQGGGRIINISSLGGLMSLPYNSAYAASKFALEGYSESLRYELLPHNIYVSLVEAAAVQTDTLAGSIRSVREGHPAYAPQRERMVERMHRAGSGSQVKPLHIAQTVQRIIETPSPRLRYTVGATAQLIPLLKTLLPQRLFEGFIIRQFIPSVSAPKHTEGLYVG